MEQNLDKTLDETSMESNVIGCILSDCSGLCLAAKGNASTDSAGIIAAIANQAAKLEPQSSPPVVSFQNDSRQCIIHRQGPVIGAIYKNIS